MQEQWCRCPMLQRRWRIGNSLPCTGSTIMRTATNSTVWSKLLRTCPRMWWCCSVNFSFRSVCQSSMMFLFVWVWIFSFINGSRSNSDIVCVFDMRRTTFLYVCLFEFLYSFINVSRRCRRQRFPVFKLLSCFFIKLKVFCRRVSYPPENVFVCCLFGFL